MLSNHATKGRLLATVLVTILVVCTAFALYFKSPTLEYNYEITLRFQTPTGVVQGSSVISTYWQDNRSGKFNFPEARKIMSKVDGEAVIVDISNGKTIFGLLAAGPNASDDVDFDRIAPVTLGVKFLGDLVDLEKAVRQAESHGNPLLVPRSIWPTLLTLSDPDNPKTATIVSPDQISAVFGPGYGITDVTIRFTRKPATRGIELRLPWLPRFVGYLGGMQPDLKKINPAHNLTWHVFSKGHSLEHGQAPTLRSNSK